jgi:histone H3/H4
MSETLVVVSKVKAFIKNNSPGFSTSAAVADVLTKMVEAECRKAIENAKNEGRKTVMERDFPPTSV